METTENIVELIEKIEKLEKGFNRIKKGHIKNMRKLNDEWFRLAINIIAIPFYYKEGSITRMYNKITKTINQDGN